MKTEERVVCIDYGVVTINNKPTGADTQPFPIPDQRLEYV